MKLTSVTSNDNDLIRAYLDGTLAGAQRDAFELRLLQEPHLQDQVDMDIALRQGLRAHGAEPGEQAGPEPVPLSSPSHLPGASLPGAGLPERPPSGSQMSRSRSRHGSVLALAASFVAGMVVPTLLWLGAHQPRPSSEAAFAPRGNVPTLLIDPVRSANTDTVLVIAPHASLLLLQVPVYPQHTDERYSLRIERENGEPVAELDQLVPDGDALISALLPASSLPSGRYRLDLQSLHAGTIGEQRRIVLRVTSMG